MYLAKSNVFLSREKTMKTNKNKSEFFHTCKTLVLDHQRRSTAHPKLPTKEEIVRESQVVAVEIVSVIAKKKTKPDEG